jgi:hypothetical protein
MQYSSSTAADWVDAERIQHQGDASKTAKRRLVLRAAGENTMQGSSRLCGMASAGAAGQMIRL